MGKTAVGILLKDGKIQKKYDDATEHAGLYEGPEYRIRSEMKGHCDICGVTHFHQSEGPWIWPDKPVEIGLNWAKKHNFLSVVEVRLSRYRINTGGKTVYQGTKPDYGSFEPICDWMPFKTISASGKVIPVGIEPPRKKIQV